jgi:excinuclease ABC subunit C
MLRDGKGKLLYVGKAASLRNRLSSYFGSRVNLTPMVRQMVSRVADFEFIVADSEDEALLLECNLIKKFRPPYNVRLRDDKNYPYLKITLQEDFPRVQFTRRVLDDGARYFGPFANAGSVRETMALLKRLFPYRSCNKVITGEDTRPCLDYHLGRCSGACIGAVTKEEYRQTILQAIQFLEGDSDEVIHSLHREMEQTAEEMQFERAARLRDQIQAIQRVVEGQDVKVTSLKQDDVDVIGLARDKDEAWVEAFFIRKGKMVGRDRFGLEGVKEVSPQHVLGQFVKQFYASASSVPGRVILQHSLEDRTLIERWLSQKKGRKVSVEVARRGNKLKLVKMAAENAVHGLEQRRARWLADTGAHALAMTELQESLGLPRLPQRIECYDISNIQGSNAVGSMVVAERGVPKPSHYRRFRIKNVSQVDDYAMMQEVLRRRFKRLAARGKNGQNGSEEMSEAWGIIPDLVLIDGGKGHLSAAQEVFLELGIDFVPLASIAKENEWLFVTHVSEPIVLPRNSQGLFLIQRTRDEAHRFAISYHQRLRSRRSMTSAMDVVPGIGPKRKRMLLRHFGSLKGIREAKIDDIAAVPGMTRRLAETLKEHL